jgi:site-specific DNA-methyltransferase (adenine-specific)
MIEIINSDCLEAMKKMADNSIDFIVTDPPYGLNFMGKGWDYDIPDKSYWLEMLRIIKPGGYLAAMGGARTFHRLFTKIEDSGFEIRDCIMWLYGSGFPKSHNKFGLEGYGTSLKPAYEPITLAMKPLHGTYAQNVQKWGIGGLNIDECRVGKDQITTHSRGKTTSFAKRPGEKNVEDGNRHTSQNRQEFIGNPRQGRWPANLILSEESAALLDQQSGMSKSASGLKRKNNYVNDIYNLGFKKQPNEILGYNDSGGVSRFFYCAKASSRERQGSKHPTIKPKKLIEYIIKLLAPPGNPICLDPFMGSGTCGIVCKELGIRFIGIELQKDYFDDAKRRIDLAQFQPEQLELFTK